MSVRTRRPTGSTALAILAAAACSTESGSQPMGPEDPPGAPCRETFLWRSTEPRAVDPSSTGMVELTLAFPSCLPRTVRLTRLGSLFPFEKLDETTARLTMSVADLLAGHDPNELHHFIGFIDLFSETGDRYSRINGFVNVRTATVPDVGIESVAPDAQASPHVVNLVVDEPFLGTQSDPSVPRRFYQLFPDDYHFLAIVNAAEVVANRTYRPIRNEVSGIGLSPIDQGSSVGSAATLEGLIHYPTSTFFDLAGPGAVHEIGHRWVNFFEASELGQGVPHWPISDLADGVMGFNIPGTGVGGSMLGRLVEVSPGVFRHDCTGGANYLYEDLALYAMGLIPPDSVAPHTVYADQEQSLSCGATWSSASTQITIEDIVASSGARVPAWPDAQTEFRLATVVLSTGRLLSAEEMAFFDHLAARGEATEPLPFTSGFVSDVGAPFFVATGGRARLITRR